MISLYILEMLHFLETIKAEGFHCFEELPRRVFATAKKQKRQRERERSLGLKVTIKINHAYKKQINILFGAKSWLKQFHPFCLFLDA